ncbi:hypothetical protein [Lonepinella koalarum]|uniref:hypothetical protein n=1 Tax=Lonepinella koalarum TaxID=53417 RepID=UPI003F6E0C4F
MKLEKSEYLISYNKVYRGVIPISHYLTERSKEANERSLALVIGKHRAGRGFL